MVLVLLGAAIIGWVHYQPTFLVYESFQQVRTGEVCVAMRGLLVLRAFSFD